MTETLDQFIGRLITFMELSEYRTRSVNFQPNQMKPMWFDGAEPFLEAGAHLTHAKYEDTYLIPTDAMPHDLVRPLDVTIIGRENDHPDGFAGARYRKINDPKMVRGHVVRPARYMVDQALFGVDGHGEGWVQRCILGSPDAVNFYNISKGQVGTGEYDEPGSDRLRIAHGLAFIRPMFWYVKIGYVGHPGILLPTDPVGAREVFRLRDIPEGKSRRQAIRHWVTEHWRRDRIDPGEEVKVREHLRAQTQFTWNGMHVEIRPSLDDLERARRAKAQRDADRAEGVDRRPREEHQIGANV